MNFNNKVYPEPRNDFINKIPLHLNENLLSSNLEYIIKFKIESDMINKYPCMSNLLLEKS
ncbi:hypothetical protein [Actinobacillus capsulatus]|uniref:hypothetical protein n=1 Tax=Actinobacillus capsulatus TaxID=717 RepID=UPI000380C175|nr:hypothetical protein [Actinobacillus capsulatus]